LCLQTHITAVGKGETYGDWLKIFEDNTSKTAAWRLR
jgi:hypothetical protein